MNRVYLGLDTSNYTTSAALCTEDGKVLLNRKMLLPVREGERGLRQSDAVFLHVKALTDTAEALKKTIAEIGTDTHVEAIGVSVSPRDCADSYMPCFLVGEAVARMVAAVMQVPVYTFSHQAGHVMAAVHSAYGYNIAVTEKCISSPFLAFHVSGGTTEILLSEPEEKNLLQITKLGGTLDLNAGQLIDRIGVKMGMSFPCGAEMDILALEYSGKVRQDKIHVKNLQCNLSGIENKGEQLWKETGDKAAVSAYVLSFVGRTLEEMTEQLKVIYPDFSIIYAGGVMSSQYIRRSLAKYGCFAEAKMSSDNAVGTALLARQKHCVCKDGGIENDK